MDTSLLPIVSKIRLQHFEKRALGTAKYKSWSRNTGRFPLHQLFKVLSGVCMETESRNMKSYMNVLITKERAGINYRSLYETNP